MALPILFPVPPATITAYFFMSISPLKKKQGLEALLPLNQSTKEVKGSDILKKKNQSYL